MDLSNAKHNSLSILFFAKIGAQKSIKQVGFWMTQLDTDFQKRKNISYNSRWHQDHEVGFIDTFS